MQPFHLSRAVEWNQLDSVKTGFLVRSTVNCSKGRQQALHGIIALGLVSLGVRERASRKRRSREALKNLSKSKAENTIRMSALGKLNRSRPSVT